MEITDTMLVEAMKVDEYHYTFEETIWRDFVRQNRHLFYDWVKRIPPYVVFNCHATEYTNFRFGRYVYQGNHMMALLRMHGLEVDSNVKQPSIVARLLFHPYEKTLSPNAILNSFDKEDQKRAIRYFVDTGVIDRWL